MILVVDDDPSVTGAVGLLLEQSGYQCSLAASPDEALQSLRRSPCDLVIQDMNFSRRTTGEEGLELVRRIKESWPDLPVILLTAWGSIGLAVEGMKAGAADFVTKPWDNSQLLRSVETLLALGQEATEEKGAPPTTREQLDAEYDFGELVGRDPRMLRILKLVGRIGPTDATVVISGESGTGKEVLAEVIHRNSRRADKPFVKVNLGGISSTLFESEMFGHVRGAFTDARDERQGRFALADGGTIFLDEIGEIEPSAQVKLLRVLQDRTYEVLGSSRTRRVDLRVIAATNRDLPAMVETGEFREDLMYRLNLISIELPPLRQRRGDVPLLADRFLGQCSRSYGRGSLSFSASAARWLESQPWPGNIRQLRQVIERGVLVSEGHTLEVDDLMALSDLEPPSRDEEGFEHRLPEADSLTLKELERTVIEKCLEHFDGNVTHAAKSLGLSRGALYRRCEKYGLKAGR